MKLLKKIKKLLQNKKRFKKYVYWLLLPLAILFLLFIVRACSHKPLILKTVYLIGRENILQIELLGRERNLIAFTNDLLAAIATENHLRFQWIETNPSNLLNGLDNGSYDFILTSIRPNIVNQERYDFSESIFDLGPVLIVREDSMISSLKDMQGLQIGISYGLSTNFNAVKTPGINIFEMSFIYYNNMNRALDDLTNGTISGVIMKAIPAYAITQGLYAGKLKVVTPPFNDEGLRIVSLKNSSGNHIITMINESINKMRQDGSYHALITKWNLINAQSQFSHPEDNKE